jgi:hypothetical protein
MGTPLANRNATAALPGHCSRESVLEPALLRPPRDPARLALLNLGLVGLLEVRRLPLIQDSSDDPSRAQAVELKLLADTRTSAAG